MSADPSEMKAYESMVQKPLLASFGQKKNSVQFDSNDPDLSQIMHLETPNKVGIARTASYSMPHESKLSLASTPGKLPRIEAFSPMKKNKFFKVDRFSVLQPAKRPDPKEEEKERLILKRMEESFEIEKADLKTNPMVSPKAVKAYYDHYKKISKVNQQNDYFKISDSVQTAMLKRSELIEVLPCKIGVIKSKGSEHQLQLSHQKYGDRYASVLSEGLKVHPNIKEFILANNRIKSSGATQILNQIGRNAKVIDLQQNEIGSLGVEAICQQIQIRENKIEVLNLEDNKLGDRNVQKIIKTILNSHDRLKSLNFSKNFLTNDTCDLIKELISNSDQLEELYLHWNQIKGLGGQKIFEALTDNKNLVVFDISWNSLGVQDKKEVQCVQKICDFLTTNKTMVHIDLSANQFQCNDCKQIAQSLVKNRTIYGFHFTGNWGRVDPRGFLEIQENEIQKVLGETPRIRGLEQISFTRHESVCWICEGWQEQTFQWTPQVSGEGECDPVFVHLDFEDYKQVYIPKRKDETIAYNLMIPSGLTCFLYTVTDTQQVAQDQPTIPHGHPIKLNSMGVQVNALLDKLNFSKKAKHFRVIDSREFKAMVSVLPRTPDPIYIPPKMKKQKRVWTFPISIWYKDFKFETEDLLRKCFEKDWSCSKIMKIVKNPDELLEVKNVLWTYYRLLKESYKQYSSLNPTGDVWSISSNYITEFAQQTELIDNKTLKLSDLDLKYIATCAASIEYKGNFRNPERSLCRFQFMEFLVRVSEDKYLKTKIAANMLESTKMMLEQCKPYMSNFDAQKWRNEKYFNEQCDDCLKFFKNLLNNIYNRYSVKKVKPGQKKFMCLDELQDICSHCNLFDERFVERDANLAFNLSMLLQVDELESDRLFQMQFIEFLEAVARIADKVSLPAIGSEDLNWEQRFAQPLHLKLERLCVLMANNCASEDYKLNFGNISKSMFQLQEDSEDG